nr:MAG TPA: secretion system protein [Caudoviricetes sp.]
MIYYDTFKMTNGDIDIVDNDLVLVSGQEEMRQNAENRLSVNKSEWFLNLDLGLSYKDITGKGISDADIEYWIRECILQDERIKEVRKVIIDRNPALRTADIDVTIIDPYEQELMLSGVIDIG